MPEAKIRCARLGPEYRNRLLGKQRRLAWVFVAFVALWGCGGEAGVNPSPVEYLRSAGARRAGLIASLVNPNNGYSLLRIANYGRMESAGAARANAPGWEALDESNPRTESIAEAELDGKGVDLTRGLSDAARALSWDSGVEAGDLQALRALGEEAFFTYPVQSMEAAALALASRENVSRFGLWIDARRGVGGVVRVALADGTVGLALTCATCHAATRARATAGSIGRLQPRLQPGVANDQLDLGGLAAAWATARGRGTPSAVDPALQWGRGRLDVSTLDGSLPARIPDLRPTRYLTHLHHDATVEQLGLTSLAIRIETLIITAHAETLRPPRQVAMGLAVYLWSLGDEVANPVIGPAVEIDSAARGQRLFEAWCVSCHRPPSLAGPPVAIEVVGTDPAQGRSPERGTGNYRVPSLRGVASRGLLLHDGALDSLDALLDPRRLESDYSGRARGGPGAVPGHSYGLSLDEAARRDLAAYLKTL